MAQPWTSDSIPDLTGQRAIVTGATSGIGLVTAAELALRGAAVTLAVRNTERGRHVATAISARRPDVEVRVEELDVASLASVRAFAERWLARKEALDLLINNAGVMAIPRAESPDGHELQLATNHLGHFALTGLLLPAIADAPRARVVAVSSSAHRIGRVDFDDLMGERSYSPWRAYGQSKLANLLFTAELERRLTEARLGAIAVAAHPGYSATNLGAASASASGNALQARIMGFGERLVAQSAEMGALPTLYAATDPRVTGGDFIGPGGFAGMRGYPVVVGRSSAARDAESAARLWDVSEQLTGVRFL